MTDDCPQNVTELAQPQITKQRTTNYLGMVRALIHITLVYSTELSVTPLN